MYIFVPMSVEHAEEIVYNWKYEEQYSFYNMTEDEEDLKDFLNQETWDDSAYAVLNEQRQLVGFFQYNIHNSELVIGLGLKPELTGMGLGEKFVQSGLSFGISKFKDKADCVVLCVASFNKRAIRIYEKLGFEIVKQELVHTNKKDYEFLTMKKTLPVDDSIIQDEKFIKYWEKKRKKGKIIYLLKETINFIISMLFGSVVLILLYSFYLILFKGRDILALKEIFKDVINNLNVMSILPFIAALSSTIISTFLNWYSYEKRYNELLIKKIKNQ